MVGRLANEAQLRIRRSLGSRPFGRVCRRSKTSSAPWASTSSTSSFAFTRNLLSRRVRLATVNPLLHHRPLKTSEGDESLEICPTGTRRTRPSNLLQVIDQPLAELFDLDLLVLNMSSKVSQGLLKLDDVLRILYTWNRLQRVPSILVLLL